MTRWRFGAAWLLDLVLGNLHPAHTADDHRCMRRSALPNWRIPTRRTGSSCDRTQHESHCGRCASPAPFLSRDRQGDFAGGGRDRVDSSRRPADQDLRRTEPLLFKHRLSSGELCGLITIGDDPSVCGSPPLHSCLVAEPSGAKSRPQPVDAEFRTQETGCPRALNAPSATNPPEPPPEMRPSWVGRPQTTSPISARRIS